MNRVRERSNRRRAGGFTLLEVMAALTIFMTGVIGVLALFTTGLALHRDAQRKSMIAIASDEVRGRVEAWLSRAIETPEEVELPAIDGVPLDGHPGYFCSATLAVDPELGRKGGLLARVTVFAIDAGKELGTEFTIFVRPGARPESLIRDALGLGPLATDPIPGKSAVPPPSAAGPPGAVTPGATDGTHPKEPGNK